MADRNGYVSADHLILFNGIPVSKLIYPNLVAASLDFHRQGYTFSVASPAGGDRPYDVQGAMQRAYDAGQFGVAPFYLNRFSSSRPADEGHSRHGFALSIDAVTNAPTAKRNQILADHGFHLWSKDDPNHFEPNWLNVLVAPPESAFASLGSSGLDNTPPPIRTAQQMTSMILEASGITGTPTFLLERDATGAAIARRFNGTAEYQIVTGGLDGLTTHKAGGDKPPATAQEVAAANQVTLTIFAFFGFTGITVDQIAAVPPGGSIKVGGTPSGGGSVPVDTEELAKAIAALLPVQNPGAVAEAVLELLKPLFDPRLVAALPVKG